MAEAAAIGALATDVYSDVKAAGKALVDKLRDPQPGPETGAGQGGGSDPGPGTRHDG